MAIKVVSAAEASNKWATRASGAAADFQAKAAASGPDWEANARASAANFKLAVSAGDIERRFTNGVNGKAGKFARKINAVGGSRFSTGVNEGKPEMQAGIEPVLATIAGVTLPPRRPRGDPANNARITPITQALAALRLRQTAAGG